MTLAQQVKVAWARCGTMVGGQMATQDVQTKPDPRNSENKTQSIATLPHVKTPPAAAQKYK